MTSSANGITTAPRSSDQSTLTALPEIPAAAAGGDAGRSERREQHHERRVEVAQVRADAVLAHPQVVIDLERQPIAGARARDRDQVDADGEPPTRATLRGGVSGQT